MLEGKDGGPREGMLFHRKGVHVEGRWDKRDQRGVALDDFLKLRQTGALGVHMKGSLLGWFVGLILLVVTVQ
jgi:hypothetical protein